MTNFKVPGFKYASQINPGDWLYVPQHGFPVDYNKVKSPANRCFLVALNEDSINAILVFLGLAHRYKLWGFENASNWTPAERDQWDEIEAFVSETEYCLMNGCNVGDLISTNRMLVAALVGETLDLSTDLPDNVDYTVVGIGPRLDNLEAKLQGIADKIDQLEATVTAGNADDDDIEEILDSINEVLGGEAILP